MIRAAIISVGVAVSATSAGACTQPLTACTSTNGVESYLDGYNGSVVLFSNHPRLANGDQGFEFVVAECESRQSLTITQPAEVTDNYYNAEILMVEAVHDDEPQTLRALARQIERLGIDARVGQLPGGHCGCSLPTLPEPYFSCPVD